MATLKQLAASLSEKEKGLYRSGLEEFERLRIRLSPGQLIVVGGRPGIGKTPFLLFLYSQLWQMNNLPQLFISIFSDLRESGMIEENAAKVLGPDKATCKNFRMEEAPPYLVDQYIRSLECKNKFVEMVKKYS